VGNKKNRHIWALLLHWKQDKLCCCASQNICVVAIHLLTIGTFEKAAYTRTELGLGNPNGNHVLVKLEDIRTLHSLRFLSLQSGCNRMESTVLTAYVAILFCRSSSGLACAIFIVDICMHSKNVDRDSAAFSTVWILPSHWDPLASSELAKSFTQTEVRPQQVLSRSQPLLVTYFAVYTRK